MEVWLSLHNKENLVVWDDGIIHNYSAEMLSLYKDNPKMFNGLIKNTAYVFCYCSPEIVSKNIWARQRSEGQTRPQHKNKTQEELLDINIRALEKRHAFFNLLKEHNVSFLDINTEENLRDNARKVVTFINKLHLSHSQ